MRAAPKDLVAISAGAGDVMINDFQPVEQSPYKDLCWAACAAMVMTHLGKPMALGDVVVAVLGQFEDRTAWPETAYDALGVGCLYLDVANVDDAGVRQWIDADYPLQPYIRWLDGSGDHVLIISGVYADGRLRLYDPLYGENSTNTLQDLKTGYGEGVLDGLWYDMAVKA